MEGPDDIEPETKSSSAQPLARRRFSNDMHGLSPDEIDGLMSSSEGRPFLVVHRLPEIKMEGVPALMPGIPITCRVDNTEKHTTRSKVRVGTLYTVFLTHGHFHWSVKRKYKHFQELHRDLYKHKMMLAPDSSGQICKGPSAAEGHVGGNAQPPRKYLEEYLNGLLENSFCRNDHSMIEFLSVAALSFITDLGPKGLEGPISKRSGGHRIQGLNCIGHHQFCFRWSRRWLVVKDSFLMYMNRDNGKINFVLLFDPEFKVKVGRAYTDTKYGVCFENFTRSLRLPQSSTFEGFAPPREDTLTKWFVNGSGFLSDLADALEQAKEEIFITDWWLSPEVFLKRPATDNFWRLDEILKRKVRNKESKCVFCCTREVEMALGINSEHSKKTLMNMHPNIKVMRHPDHVSSVVFLWAHHEKMPLWAGSTLAFGRWDDRLYRLTDLGLRETSDTVTGEETDGDTGDNTGCNWTDRLKITSTALKFPRMPWRDLSAACSWPSLQGMSPATSSSAGTSPRSSKTSTRTSSTLTSCPSLTPTADSPPRITVPGSKKAKVQVLRSADRWSTGICENSILNAYIHTIENSEHYIYIENQFFISCADGKDRLQRDRGCNCETKSCVHTAPLLVGIVLLHSEQKKYRVFVVVPLLPGFEGDIALGTGVAIRAILHFTYRTMCRGEHSILSRLSEVMDQWTEYISFCGLRTHSQLGESLVTELIYVHSKFLIADDRCYIIGSANINDRSMLGSRDSEMAVFVEDEERVPSTMGGQEYQAGPLTLALRKECFRVLVGASSDPSVNIDDPISDEFFFLGWNEPAKLNAEIYEKVFKCLPNNSVHNMRELKEYSAHERLCDSDPEQAREELKAVRGLLVHFPQKFLCEEYLLPPMNTKEGMAPVGLWT
ncbi:hypothetical protein KUCAC02_003842 [Chaenocephalus aceratus]|uniref:Uncharacterized protein n=1 Tax=Chaenocephalus aceratus TaxID=36190 RepID=A0ACB9WM23_CHAAC|nr:hypothetical protein KUCAC02_003842 [Chaenocephalus aceratus]